MDGLEGAGGGKGCGGGEGAAAARGRSGSVGRTGEGATAAASFFRDAQAEVMKYQVKHAACT